MGGRENKDTNSKNYGWAGERKVGVAWVGDKGNKQMAG
jgi:hypothetical protein